MTRWSAEPAAGVDLEQNFGTEIAGLVDGVTKLSQLELFSERTKQDILNFLRSL